MCLFCFLMVDNKNYMCYNYLYNRKENKMKKLNVKGFTLIELLAVITIMGILMLVAIPTVSRTIENSRKDTFLDTVKQYTNSVKIMWAADNLTCKVGLTDYVSSAVPNGLYGIQIDTSNPTAYPVLLEQGGKSPWGSRDMKGIILVYVQDDNGTRKIDYYPVFVDGVHGINIVADTSNPGKFIPSTSIDVAGRTNLILADNLKRGNIVMSGAAYDSIYDSYFEGSTSIYDCDGGEITTDCVLNKAYQPFICSES